MFPAVEGKPALSRDNTTTSERETVPRLVAVSNRVVESAAGAASGGLAVALSEAVAETGGLWFGWSGRVDRAARITAPRLGRNGHVQLATLDLTPEEHQGYYQGFANGCLWPAFHYRLDLMRYRPEERRYYDQVNARFAANLRPLLRIDDLVWAHDFHLIPLAAALRRQSWAGPAGFFLHTPFPSPDIFAAIPGHRELGRALLAYDVVGFQTDGDRRNFAAYAERHLGARGRGKGGLEAGGRAVATAALPVGIDMDAVKTLAERATGGGAATGRPGVAGDGPGLIVGVDRLDYTKGIPERLLAFERLLQRRPDLHGKVTLVQISPPTRQGVHSYDELTSRVQRLVGRVNGAFGTFDWTPIAFVNRPLERRFLLPLFRRADVGLVTPLRDGMNLVAKEYVAAQDAADPGVLVLSQFAGAAEQLTAALTVNPHDVDAVAEALDAALAMSLDARRARHRALHGQVARTDIGRWRSGFLRVLSARGKDSIGALDASLAGAA